MTDQDFFPPLVHLSSDEIEAQKQHLLSEIARQPQRARLPLHVPASKRTRMLGLAAAAGAAAVAAAIAVALSPTSGGRSPLSPHSAALPLAPLYSFHASITSTSRSDRYYSPASVRPDAAYSRVSLVGALASKKHIPRAVLVLAAAQARSYGNRGPTRVQWLKTTRQKAVSAENAGRVDGGNLPVYFVILHGHFVDKLAHLPLGAKPPRGRIVTYAIELKTGWPLDFGIGNSEPNFSQAGKPHHFVIYGHRRSR